MLTCVTLVVIGGEDDTTTAGIDFGTVSDSLAVVTGGLGCASGSACC